MSSQRFPFRILQLPLDSSRNGPFLAIALREGEMLPQDPQDSLVPPTADWMEASHRMDSRLALGFVVLWSRSDPALVGAFGSLGLERSVGILGRGGPLPDDPYDRMVFVQNRPFSDYSLPPPSNLRLSRRQVMIREQDGRSLFIENVGKCAAVLRGAPRSHGRVVLGDLLELRRELLLMCVERPTVVRKVSLPAALVPAFGQADLFGIVGESRAIWSLREQVAAAARRSGDVHLLSARGVPSVQVAQAIHALSVSSAQRLLCLNARALVESLFGSGDVNAEQAHSALVSHFHSILGGDGASLFFDELSSLSPSLQAVLVQSVDETFSRRRALDASAGRYFRLIGAVHPQAQLSPMLAARLHVHVRIPPLEERREDIPLLCSSFLRRLAEESPQLVGRFFDRQEPRFSVEFIAALVRHAYSANDHELREVLRVACRTSPAGRVVLTSEVQELLGDCSRR